MLKGGGPKPVRKERVSGRGPFARRGFHYLPADDSKPAEDAALLACFAELSERPTTFAEAREQIQRQAEAFLSAKGLPSRPWVFFPSSDPRQWSYDAPLEIPAGGGSSSSLEWFLVGSLKHGKQSPEALAARCIALAEESRSADAERAKAAAFSLGFAWAEATEREYVRHHGGERGRAINKAKTRAIEYLSAMIKKRPAVTQAEAWNALCASGDDWIFCEDGDDKRSLKFEAAEAVWSCSESSFPKSLWRPAKKLAG